MSADHVIVVCGLAVLGVACLYKVVGWADLAMDGVGASSVEYAAYSPGVWDVTEADFQSASAARP